MGEVAGGTAAVLLASGRRAAGRDRPWFHRRGACRDWLCVLARSMGQGICDGGADGDGRSLPIARHLGVVRPLSRRPPAVVARDGEVRVHAPSQSCAAGVPKPVTRTPGRPAVRIYRPPVGCPSYRQRQTLMAPVATRAMIW